MADGRGGPVQLYGGGADDLAWQMDAGDRYSCTVEELERKRTHRAAVATYLRDRHRRRFVPTRILSWTSVETQTTNRDIDRLRVMFGRRGRFVQKSVYEDGPEFSLGPANTAAADYDGFAVDMGMRGCDGLRSRLACKARVAKVTVFHPSSSMHSDMRMCGCGASGRPHWPCPARRSPSTAQRSSSSPSCG